MKRRHFLKGAVPTALTIPLALNGLRFRALAQARQLGSVTIPAGTEENVLVIIQLVGGNDGLNTVIPVDDDLYHTLRPTLRIEKDRAIPIDGQPLLRLHPGLGGMATMFNEGRMAIVENIGYDDYSLSHFAGTEIWNTGSGGTISEYLGTGWMGRYLLGDFPQFPDVLPDDPPAIQIGPATASVFSARGSSIGVALTNPAGFYEMVNGGPDVPDDPLTPSTPADAEWHFVRSVNAQALGFSASIRAAAQKAQNIAPYPQGNDLAESLAIVARLIAGGLKTRVYMVSIGNFDTHSNQLEPHAILLGRLGEAVKAFMDDLIALGIDSRVTGMTYSEFGRRVMDNGSGSDHGAAAPHFVFGTPIDGGKIHGGLPDLQNLDDAGNLRHAITFQCYYASVLAPFFGVEENRLREVLPLGLCDTQSRIRLYKRLETPAPIGAGAIAISNRPNPASTETIINYMLPHAGHARLSLLTTDGRSLGHLVDEAQREGSHALRVDLRGLAPGTYIYRLDIGGASGMGRMIVVR